MCMYQVFNWLLMSVKLHADQEEGGAGPRKEARGGARAAAGQGIGGQR